MKKREDVMTLQELITEYHNQEVTFDINHQNSQLLEDALTKIDMLTDKLNQLETRFEESNLRLIGEDISKSTHDFNLEIKYMLDELSIE